MVDQGRARAIQGFRSRMSAVPIRKADPQMTGVANDKSGRVVLYLIESERGTPIQFWTFENDLMIRVGRGADNELIVLNPYVSRTHAYIGARDGRWTVSSLSDQGLFHRSQKLQSLPLYNGCEFRLGPAGPFLRFCQSTVSETTESTLMHLTPNQPMLVLDSKELNREVSDIVESDFFQRLKSSLKELRQPRQPSPSDEVTRV